MSSVGLSGGLGEPGEAGVEWGGKETTLGGHAPTRGASPEIRTRIEILSASKCGPYSKAALVQDFHTESL
jgi:hypothetical protein